MAQSPDDNGIAGFLSRLSFTTRFRTGAKDKRHEEVLRIKWHEVVVLDWRR